MSECLLHIAHKSVQKTNCLDSSLKIGNLAALQLGLRCQPVWIEDMSFVSYNCVSKKPAQAVLHLLQRERSMYYLHFPAQSHMCLMNALWFIRLCN